MTTTEPQAVEPTEAPGAHWLALANETPDPLECIAMALTGLLDVTVKLVERHDGEQNDQALVTALDEELAEQRRVVEAVRAAVGKSTAGWADKIREALGDAGGDSAPSMPEHNADLEVWREYARTQGFDGDLTQMNRSQIRTALGLPNA